MSKKLLKTIIPGTIVGTIVGSTVTILLTSNVNRTEDYDKNYISVNDGPIYNPNDNNKTNIVRFNSCNDDDE